MAVQGRRRLAWRLHPRRYALIYAATLRRVLARGVERTDLTKDRVRPGVSSERSETEPKRPSERPKRVAPGNGLQGSAGSSLALRTFSQATRFRESTRRAMRPPDHLSAGARAVSSYPPPVVAEGCGAPGFSASLGMSLPAGLPKYLKKSESGRSTSRVSLARSPAS